MFKFCEPIQRFFQNDQNSIVIPKKTFLTLVGVEISIWIVLIIMLGVCL